jgi:hypothetical protein
MLKLEVQINADVGTPNKLLQITSSTPIAKVVFFNGGERGNTYTIDDFFFGSEQTCQISGVPYLFATLIVDGQVILMVGVFRVLGIANLEKTIISRIGDAHSPQRPWS